MHVHVSHDAAASVVADALVVPVFTDTVVDGVAAEVDALLGGAIADVLAAGETAGKAYEKTLVHAKGAPFKRVLVVGLGDRAKLTASELARYAGTAVRYLGRRGGERIAFTLPAGLDGGLAASFVAEGALTGALDTTTYRSQPDRPVRTGEVTILVGGYPAAAVEAGAQRGSVLGQAINLARLMALTPANDMTPTDLARRAEQLARDAGLEFDLLDEARMEAKGMGSLLGVSRGSAEPATLSVMTYTGDPGSSEILALVGKGLTFDSGGISLKPSENMHEMKYDMSGGAGVIATMWALGKLRPKLNVIGLVPASENMPGSRAMKPGDILRAMNGKTIEVLNTDAEGRLILADALCYACELGATKIVDTATLTGGCVIALGHVASGTMTNDDAFVERFLAVVRDCGERYWRLPIFPEYEKQIESEIADLKNTGGRAASTETAAAFLKAFVGQRPWIHLDIAGTAYGEFETSYLAKGPNGTPIRALLSLVEDLAQNAAGPATNGVAKSAGVATSALTA